MYVSELGVRLNLSLPDFIISLTSGNHDYRAKSDLIMKFVGLFAKNNTNLFLNYLLHENF